jgi:hypothetical protein
MKRYIYVLTLQLLDKTNDRLNDAILVELRVCSLQGVFGGHMRNSRSVLSAGYPAANQSNERHEVR